MSGELDHVRGNTVNFSIIKEQLDKVTQLNDVESLNDPEDNPYASKYKAREILESIRKVIDNAMVDDHDEEEEVVVVGVEQTQREEEQSMKPNEEFLSEATDPTQVTLLLESSTESAKQNVADSVFTYTHRLSVFRRYIDARLGANYIDCEETSSGEEHLKNAVAYLESKCEPLSQMVCYTYMYTLNQLGILYASRRQTDKAVKVLTAAEDTYTGYKQREGLAPLLPIDTIRSTEFCSVSDTEDTIRWDSFEKEHTQTLYYLAQVYQKGDDAHKAAHYCQITLRRQLVTKHYNPVDWALNAATLSQYYVTEESFPLARHCLASSMKILEEAGDVVVTDEDGSLYQRTLDIKRCWIKYGISLLEVSFTRLMSDPTVTDECDEKKNEDFFDLELTLYENWMTDQYVLDFPQARAVFLKVQEFINDCKQLYEIDTYCSDYVELVQDHSRIFKFLQNFEDDLSRQCKMFKRRSDMLEHLTRELNPQYYLLVWRQLVYELAEIYSAMLDCKVTLAASENRQTSHSIEKINSLCEKSITKYKEYVTSLKTPDGKLPDPLPEGDERPTMVAWFCIGRLYSKLIQSDKWKHIENVRQQHFYYKLLVDHCDSHPKDCELMKEELTVCRELVVLLPAKIDKLVSQAELN